MPPTGAPQSASRILNCYVCNQRFPKSDFDTELNEDGHECCPECGSEFVEIIDQTEQASTSTVASGSNVGGQSAARNDPPGDAGAGGSRSGGASRVPRVEVHAMFHSDSGDAPDMPMSFVDAISRFAPLSLPNGQQAFVLQVQDGALLSPFTMGVPFSDAIAMNPEDWVVGDDLDAVVSRVLDAYMPPRRSTATEVLNTLPRLRVRGGPLSPRPTATLEAAARAATSTPSNPSHLHVPNFSSTDAVASSGGFGGDSGEEDDESARTGRATISGGRDAGAAEARAETIKYSDVLEGRHVDSLAPSTSMAAASASSAPTMAVAPAEAKAIEPKAEVAGDGFASCQPGELCTVCHDAFKPGGEVVELPCRHCFHEDCIMPWLRQQNTCPVCRMRLLEGNNRSSVNSNSRSARHQVSSQQADATPATNAAREHERHSGAILSNGGRDDDDWQPFSDWAHSQFAHLPSAQPRRPVSGADRPADLRPQGMVPPPIPRLQQQQQRREAAGPAAGFPLLAALHPHPATGGLSTEERRAAEEALGPLRTRFAPIRLLNAPVFPTSGAGPIRGTASNIVMRPPWWPGAMAAGPTRGPLQGPTRTTDGGTTQERQRRQQQPLQGNNGGGGLSNNPMLNLFGTSGMVRPSSGSASGAPWAGGAGAHGGTRSALRGGFLTSAGGGGTGATAGPVLERRQRTQRQTPPSPSATAAVGSGARSGMASNQAAGRPSSVHAAAVARLSLGPSLVSSLMSFAPPQSAARAASAAGTGDGLRSSGGPGAASTAPCMSDRISELFDEVEEVLLRPDTAGRPQSSGTEDLAHNVSGDVSARYTAEIRRMFGPLMGVPAAAAAAVPELLDSSIPTAGTEGSPRTSSSGLASQRSRAVMEDSEPGGGPEPTEDGPYRQVARHTRLQDAATQAHQRKTSSSSNDGGDVDGNRGYNSASTSNTAVRGMGEGYGTSGLHDTRSDLARAATEATTRKISARAALATARRGHLVAAARATTPTSALAVRSSGVRRRSGSTNHGGGSGDSGEAAMTAAAAATNTSAASPPCPESGGGRGGFNPFAAVIGGAGAGLRLLGGVAGNLLLRRRPSGGSRLNAAAKIQGDSGSTEDSAGEQQ